MLKLITVNILLEMQKKINITIAGGSRGLGEKLLEIFSENGYDNYAFHKSPEIKNSLNYFFDINEESSILNLKSEFNSFVSKTDYKKYVVHFLSGGSLGVDFSDDESTSIIKVLNHNLVVPASITSSICNFAEKKNKSFDIFYYSSAVVNHYKASPYYVAAKSGLEGFFKSVLLNKSKKIRIFLLRLGYVDIKHKFFHKLSQENPNKFNDLVMNNIPSKHFAKPTEVAKFALNIAESNNIVDGTICDITGGNSWI